MHYSFAIIPHVCELEQVLQLFLHMRSENLTDTGSLAQSLKIRHLPDKTHWLMNILMLPQGPGSSWPKYLSEMNSLAKGKKLKISACFHFLFQYKWADIYKCLTTGWGGRMLWFIFSSHFLFLGYKYSYNGQFQVTMWYQWIQSLEEMLTVALSNQYWLVPVYQGTQKQQMITNVKLCPCLVSELKLTLKHSSSKDCIRIVANLTTLSSPKTSESLHIRIAVEIWKSPRSHLFLSGFQCYSEPYRGACQFLIFNAHIRRHCVFWDAYWIQVIKKSTFTSVACPQGRSRKDTKGFTVYLCRSSSDFIKSRHHTCSEGRVSYSSTSQGSGSLPAWVAWHCWEVRGNSSGSPITSVKTQCIQLGLTTWFKRAWEKSDYFLICLVKLPSAITSEMAGQELPASLQTQMDIWIIMDSQLEPLVKVACLLLS